MPEPSLPARVGEVLAAQGLTLVSAESCTGGLVAAQLTDVPGASDWFEGAFVTYRLSAKQTMLGVPEQVLNRYGAVSEPTARAMAEGALRASGADVAVSVTGIAGPAGGDVTTPVGTVWFGWARRERAGSESERIVCVQTAQHRLSGDRATVRQHAVEIALDGVLALCR